MEEAEPAPADAAAAAAAAADTPVQPARAVAEAEPAAEAEEVTEAGEAIAPVARSAPAGDPVEGIMSGLLVGAALLMAFAGSVAAAGLQNYTPDYAKWLTQNFLVYFLPGAALVIVLAVLIGWLAGRSGAGAGR